MGVGRSSKVEGGKLDLNGQGIERDIFLEIHYFYFESRAKSLEGANDTLLPIPLLKVGAWPLCPLFYTYPRKRSFNYCLSQKSMALIPG